MRQASSNGISIYKIFLNYETRFHIGDLISAKWQRKDINNTVKIIQKGNHEIEYETAFSVLP